MSMADASPTSANSKCTTKIRLACTVERGGIKGEDRVARIEIERARDVDGEELELQLEGLAIMEYQ